MTEIVKNSGSMTFDLLEAGNGGTNSPESQSVFNALFGGMGTEDTAETKNAKTNPHQNEYEESDILAITNMLTDSDLSLSDDILKEIKIRLKTLFEQINLDEVTTSNFSSEEINSLSNENFVHIMTFLEELESLIKLEKNGKDINSKLDVILNQIRIKLNEQVKAAIGKRITSKTTSKIGAKINPQAKLDATVKKDEALLNKDTSNLVEKSANAVERLKIKSSDLDALKKHSLKNETDKIPLSKLGHLNTVQKSEKKADLSMELGKKVADWKMNSLTPDTTTTSLIKNVNSEIDLVRSSVTLTNKLDSVSNFELSNTKKLSQLSQQNSDRLFHTLNMLSKGWGNNLIESIEKSIQDGMEQLEIQLTPKSLGRLNVTINLTDTIAKINIIAESANAAALLGDAESKLSQMMEASGIRLASLQTQTNQFGGNHKDKERAHKLASGVKKANIKDNLEPKENMNKLNSVNEGLNLIA